MANDSQEQTRKKLYEDYEESLFRLFLDKAAEKEGKGYLEEMERLKNNQESMPSKEVFDKFSRLLDSHFGKIKEVSQRKRILGS